MPHTKPSRETQQCIKDCCECATVCAQTAHHCLHLAAEGGNGGGAEHASPEHQGLLRDCAQICGVAVGFMARSSHYAANICRECAEICNVCADDCERLANGDAQMAQCAQVCRRCAASCEKMAAAGVTGN